MFPCQVEGGACDVYLSDRDHRHTDEWGFHTSICHVDQWRVRPRNGAQPAQPERLLGFDQRSERVGRQWFGFGNLQLAVWWGSTL